MTTRKAPSTGVAAIRNRRSPFLASISSILTERDRYADRNYLISLSPLEKTAARRWCKQADRLAEIKQLQRELRLEVKRIEEFFADYPTPEDLLEDLIPNRDT